MKKALALVLALCMIATLCACGQQAAPAASADPAAPAAESEGKKPEDYVGTIRLWSVWDEDSGAASWVEEFNKVYPNITLDIHKFSNSGDGNVQLDTALIAGEVDICMSFAAGKLEERASAGLFYPLDDFLAEAGLDSVENWGLEDNYGGKIVAIPMGGNNDHVIINKDLWDAAGLGEIPTSWTIDEYYDAARAMNKVAADGTVEVYGCSNFHSIYYWSILARGFLGDDYYYTKDEAGNLVSNITNQAFVDAFNVNYNADIVEKIQYPLITYRDEGIQAYTPFMEGKVAMCVMTNAMTRRIANTDEYTFDFPITYAPIPTLYEDQEVNYCDGIYYFMHLSIANSCPDPELAWQFVKWFSTEGSAYYSAVGHMPTYKNVDRDSIVSIAFGSEEAAAELIDVEAYKRVVLNYDGPTYIEHEYLGASEIGNVLNTVTMDVYRGNMTIEEGFEAMKAQMDAAIADAK